MRKKVFHVSALAAAIMFVFLFSYNPWNVDISKLKPIEVPLVTPNDIARHQGRDHIVAVAKPGAPASIQLNQNKGSSVQNNFASGNVLFFDIEPYFNDRYEVFLKINLLDAAAIEESYALPDHLKLIDDLAVNLSLVPKTLVDVELNKEPVLKKAGELSFLYNIKPGKESRQLLLAIYQYDAISRKWTRLLDQKTKNIQSSIIVSGPISQSGIFVLLEELSQETESTALQKQIKSLQEKIQNLLRQLQELL